MMTWVVTGCTVHFVVFVFVMIWYWTKGIDDILSSCRSESIYDRIWNIEQNYIVGRQVPRRNSIAAWLILTYSMHHGFINVTTCNCIDKKYKCKSHSKKSVIHDYCIVSLKMACILLEVNEQQWSGTHTIEFHILPQTPNAKRTQTMKTA